MKMKVLFINPFFPPWVPGGAEHSLEQMCIQLAGLGVHVEVLSLVFDDRKLDEQRNGYWVRWARAPFDIAPGQNIDIENYLNSKGCSQILRNRFEELERPSIVVANNAQVFECVEQCARENSLAAVAIIRDTQLLCEFGTCMDNQSAAEAYPCRGVTGAALCSIRFNWLRGVRKIRPLPAWAWYGLRMHRRRMRLRTVLERFDHLVTISNALELLIKNGLPGINPSKLSTIRNYSTEAGSLTDADVQSFLEKYGLKPGRFFLFAGRKTYGKGADIFVNALALARNDVPDCKGLLLGRGTVAKQNDPACLDLSPVSQELLLGVLKRAAALVIPGRWQEGLHRTMIDAIKSGIPVICSGAGAPPIDGVVSGKNGIVVSSEEPESFAAGMIEILGWNDERLEQCHLSARALFEERFSNEVISEKWLRTMSDLVATGASSLVKPL